MVARDGWPPNRSPIGEATQLPILPMRLAGGPFKRQKLSDPADSKLARELLWDVSRGEPLHNWVKLYFSQWDFFVWIVVCLSLVYVWLCFKLGELKIKYDECGYNNNKPPIRESFLLTIFRDLGSTLLLLYPHYVFLIIDYTSVLTLGWKMVHSLTKNKSICLGFHSWWWGPQSLLLGWLSHQVVGNWGHVRFLKRDIRGSTNHEQCTQRDDLPIFSFFRFWLGPYINEWGIAHERYAKIFHGSFQGWFGRTHHHSPGIFG